MSKLVGFEYGILNESLEIQANRQGYTLGKDAEKLEKIKNAISMCKFHVATDKQTDMMLKKLHKKVINALQPIEKG